MPSDILKRPFFRFYTILWNIALRFLRRNSRLADGWDERMGLSSCASKADLWLQAASGGEARLAVSVCESLPADADIDILIVTWTRQGHDVVEKAVPALASSHPGIRITIRFAPFDQPATVRSVLLEASPRLVVLLETELWPGLLASCKELAIPVFIINGRITSSTTRLGRLFPGLMRALAPEKVFAVSEAESLRFRSTLRCTVETMPNIKFDIASRLRKTTTEKMLPISFNGPLFLFASTRNTDETRIPGHLPLVYKHFPNAAIVVVPRHLHRVQAWKDMLDDLGLRPVLLSELGEKAALPRRTVLIWDRFGDLPQLYAKAAAAFVGGSFGQGGQNFLESLAAGTVPCIGPSASNFLWAMGSEGGLPSLEDAGLLHVLNTPKNVIRTMLMQAGADLTESHRKGFFTSALNHILPQSFANVAARTDRDETIRRFMDWLQPRLGGSALAAKVIMEHLEHSER